MVLIKRIDRNRCVKVLDGISIFVVILSFLLSSVNFASLFYLEYTNFVYNLIVVGFFCVIIRFIYAILTKRYTKIELIFSLVLLIYSVYLTYITKQELLLNSVDFLMYALMIVVYKDVDYMHLIKLILLAFMLSVIFTLYCCVTNFIRYGSIITDNRYRISLAFFHPVLASIKCLFIVAYYIYFMKYRIKIYEIVLLLMAAIIVYHLTITRSSFFFYDAFDTSLYITKIF